MSRSLTRPFRPLTLTPETVKAFPLQVLARELMAEKTFQERGRNALTLTHQKALTVVLTVMKGGTALKEHQASGPVLLVPLSGSMVFTKRPKADPIALEAGTSVTFGPHMLHEVEAREDSALLIVIGEQESK